MSGKLKITMKYKRLQISCKENLEQSTCLACWNLPICFLLPLYLHSTSDNSVFNEQLYIKHFGRILGFLFYRKQLEKSRNQKLSDRIWLAFRLKTCPFALSIGNHSNYLFQPFKNYSFPIRL